MVDIFYILNNLYTNKSSSWILDIDSTDIKPFLINKWLSMNIKITKTVLYLNEYTFVLEPNKWLCLANIVIPKYNRVPFIKYITKNHDENYKYQELLNRIHIFLNLKGNDIEHNNKYLFYYIENNLISLMKYFGMNKKLWRKYGLDYNEMRIKENNIKQNINLTMW